MRDKYRTIASEELKYVYPIPFGLKLGEIPHDAEVRYVTYVTLNAERDNMLEICHALTGNVSLYSLWGDLLGSGRPFDTEKYFMRCTNVLGSCYGSTGTVSVRRDLYLGVGGG